jgi:CxxC motif-containing protein
MSARRNEMMEKRVTCVVCPVGCEIIITGSEREVAEVTGFQCKKGKSYAQNEHLNPKRIFTSTVKVRNYDYTVLPVRSDAPVPKKILFECMEIIRHITVTSPVKQGQIIIRDIMGSGVNIIASTGTD